MNNSTFSEHLINLINEEKDTVDSVESIKDKGLVSLPVLVKPLLDTAPYQEKIEIQLKTEEHHRLMSLAKALLYDPGVLHRAIHTIEDMGVVGESRNIGILRLALRSRVLKRPVNIEVNSPSSTGKTQVVAGALSLEHPSAFYELTAGSEKSLIYVAESLKNRIIYIQEPEGLAEGVGAAVLKSMFWDGKLKYDTVVTEEGRLISKRIEKEGPTGLIVCTTRPLEEQISNRLLRIEVDASEEQTRRILRAIAKTATGTRPAVDLENWQAMSLLLGEPVDVIVLFGAFLAERVSVATLQIRRDFTHLLTLIAACATEHRFQRITNQNGQILATLADYGMVHSLVSETFRAVQAEGLTNNDRAMVAAVITLTTPAGGKPGQSPIAQATLRTHLNLSKSSASYRVTRLLKLGYLVNLENQKGVEMKLIPGVPLPNEPEPLPSPCELAEYLVANGYAELIIPWVDPLTGMVHDCREHLNPGNFDILSTVVPNHIEPCHRCKTTSGENGTELTNTEPSFAGVHGFKGVQSKLNPTSSSVDSSLEAS